MGTIRTEQTRLLQDNGTENTTASAAIMYFWGYKLA